MRRGLFVCAGAVLLALAGCGSAPDPVVVKACLLAEGAVNDVERSFAKWALAGSPPRGVERQNLGFYLDLRLPQLKDAYETAPQIVTVEFGDLYEAGQLVERNGTSQDAQLALILTKNAAFKACEGQGVEMQDVDPDTGETIDFDATSAF